MAKTKPKKRDEELQALAHRQAVLADVTAKLAAHTGVLAVAALDPAAAPRADLEDAVRGIGELAAILAPLREP